MTDKPTTYYEMQKSLEQQLDPGRHSRRSRRDPAPGRKTGTSDLSRSTSERLDWRGPRTSTADRGADRCGPRCQQGGSLNGHLPNARRLHCCGAMSLSRRLVPTTGNPLANTVSECEASDQDCNFKHWGLRGKRFAGSGVPRIIEELSQWHDDYLST